MGFFRDYAYFSKGERNGFIVLIAVILLLTIYVFFSKQFVPKPEHNPEVYQNLKSQFDKNYDPALAEKDGDKRRNYPNYDQGKSNTNRYSPKQKRTFAPFTFNPNAVSLEELQKLGFSKKQAQSILNYRGKGGQFRKPEDFKKMYVVSDEHYEKLKTYIVLEDKRQIHEEEAFVAEKNDSSEVVKRKTTVPNKMVDISLASEEELKTVRGIGEKLSVRIVKYRNMLGGLHNIEQLKEVYGISDENYDFIASQVQASAKIWEFVDVNKAFASELKKHPYIKTWEFANKIVFHKRKHPFKDWEDFQNKLQLDEETASKLKPYLIFE